MALFVDVNGRVQQATFTDDSSRRQASAIPDTIRLGSANVHDIVNIAYWTEAQNPAALPLVKGTRPANLPPTTFAGTSLTR
jgi:hypothetical protein